MTDILLFVVFIMTVSSSSCERQQPSNRNTKHDLFGYQVIKKEEFRHVTFKRLLERLAHGRTISQDRKIVLKYARKLRRLHRRQTLDFDSISIGGSGCTTFGCASDRAAITTTTAPQTVATTTATTTSTEPTTTDTTTSTESTTPNTEITTTSTDSDATTKSTESTTTSTELTTASTESVTTETVNLSMPSTKATSTSTESKTTSNEMAKTSTEAATTSTEEKTISTETVTTNTEVATINMETIISRTMKTASEANVNNHGIVNRTSPQRPPRIPHGPTPRLTLSKLIQHLS